VGAVAVIEFGRKAMALKQVDSLDSRVPQAAFYPGGQVLAGEPATIGCGRGRRGF
jgi:hypothetical protein